MYFLSGVTSYPCSYGQNMKNNGLTPKNWKKMFFVLNALGGHIEPQKKSLKKSNHGKVVN